MAIRRKLDDQSLNVPIWAEVHKKLTEASARAKVPMYAIASAAIQVVLEDEELWKKLTKEILDKQQRLMEEATFKRETANKIIKELRRG